MNLALWFPTEVAKPVAKEFFWLAWEACGGPFGYWPDDKPDATKDDVWDAVIKRAGIYCPYVDFVFGRKMNVGLFIVPDQDGTTILEASTEPANCLDHGWYRVYMSPAAILVKASEASTDSWAF